MVHLPSNGPCPWPCVSGCLFLRRAKKKRKKSAIRARTTLLLLEHWGLPSCSSFCLEFFSTPCHSPPANPECHLANAFSSVKSQFRYQFLKKAFHEHVGKIRPCLLLSHHSALTPLAPSHSDSIIMSWNVSWVRAGSFHLLQH